MPFNLCFLHNNNNNDTVAIIIIDDQLQRQYRYLKFFKMAVSRYLGFGPTGNNAVRSADLENPTIEPSMKWSLIFYDPLQSYDHLNLSTA